MGQVITICQFYSDAIVIHSYFLHSLGEYNSEPQESPNYVKYWVLDRYSHCTHSSV